MWLNIDFVLVFRVTLWEQWRTNWSCLRLCFRSKGEKRCNVLRDVMWRMYVEFAYYGLIKKLSWAHGRRPRFVWRGPHPVFGSDTLHTDHANHFLGQVSLFVKGQNKWKGITRPLHFVREYTKQNESWSKQNSALGFRWLEYLKESTQE